MSKVLMFAGPNGSGKSTITSKLKICGNYINADVIKSHLNCTDLEAAQNAEATREYHLSKGEDFTFETVLSTERNINLIKRAKAQGYNVVCIYVLTANPEINLERVRKRVANGGNTVPEDKIFPRYVKALRLIPFLFPICDELYIFDNTKEASECDNNLIVTSIHGNISIYPNDIWSQDMLKSLLSGTYPDDYIVGNI